MFASFRGIQRVCPKIYPKVLANKKAVNTVPFIGLSFALFSSKTKINKLEVTKFEVFRRKHPHIYSSGQSIEETIKTQKPNEAYDSHFQKVTDIHKHRIPIKGTIDETMDRIQTVCPQLSTKQLDEIERKISNGKPAKSMTIAVPSFLISDGFFVLTLYRAYDWDPNVERSYSKPKWVDVKNDKGEQLYTLDIGYQSSFPEADPVEIEDEKYSIREDWYVGSREAVDYSKKHWPDRLIKYQWDSYQNVRVIDPFDTVSTSYLNGRPKTKRIVYCGENVPHNTWINHIFTPFRLLKNGLDSSKLTYSQMWSEAVDIYTLDDVLGKELTNSRTSGTYSEFVCLYCGLPLGKTRCAQCGATFKYDDFRTYWGDETTVSEIHKNHRLPEKIRKSMESFRMEQLEEIHKEGKIDDKQKDRLTKLVDELD